LTDAYGEVSTHKITFLNESEFPKAGSFITYVTDKVPVEELVQKGFYKAMGIQDRAVFPELYENPYNEEDRDFLPLNVACIVDGRKYVKRCTEPYAHPMIVDAFKGATRV